MIGENKNSISNFSELVDAIDSDVELLNNAIFNNVELMNSISDKSNIATPNETKSFLNIN